MLLKIFYVSSSTSCQVRVRVGVGVGVGVGVQAYLARAHNDLATSFRSDKNAQPLVIVMIRILYPSPSNGNPLSRAWA